MLLRCTKCVGIFVFLGFILFISSVSGAVYEVSPGSYTLDFEPNLKQVFGFTFKGPEGSEFKISIDNEYDELSEYMKLSRERISSGENVNLLLDLPDHLDKAGPHKIRVSAQRIIEENQGMGIYGTPRGVILLRVPYPGKYAELNFRADDANVGSPVDMELTVHSRGDEDIIVQTHIDIIDSAGERVDRIDLESKEIPSTESRTYNFQLETGHLVAGDYQAVAVVNYGSGVTTEEADFRLGRLFLDIKEYSKEFEENKINRFDLIVESFWNDRIDGVYATVEFLDYDIEDIVTPSTSVDRWSRTSLTGFFDTTLVEDEPFSAKITVYYEGETTEKIVHDLRFEKEESDYMFYVILGIVLGIVVLLILIILWLTVIEKKMKKGKENED